MKEENVVRSCLIAAEEVEFLRCGDSIVSLRTIAQKAGVSIGGVYFFLGIKAVLFHAGWTNGSGAAEGTDRRNAHGVFRRGYGQGERRRLHGRCDAARAVPAGQ